MVFKRKEEAKITVHVGIPIGKYNAAADAGINLSELLAQAIELRTTATTLSNQERSRLIQAAVQKIASNMRDRDGIPTINLANHESKVLRNKGIGVTPTELITKAEEENEEYAKKAGLDKKRLRSVQAMPS